MLLPAIARRRRPERGVSLVLAMLILFVLLVVLFQVAQISTAELDQAGYYVASARLRLLADACRLQAQSVLLMDLEDAGAAEGEGEGGAGGAGGLAGAGGLGGGLGGGDEGTSAAEITGSTDSQLDEWMNSAALAPPLGEGLTLFVEIEDEDGKINLLGLWTEDEEKREAWREVFISLLDHAFEGTSQDLSPMKVKDVLDELDNWVRGERGLFTKAPIPRLKKDRALEEDAAGADEGGGEGVSEGGGEGSDPDAGSGGLPDRSLDTDIIENDMVNFPLTLGELALIEGLTPQQLSGFIEDDTYHPGLERYLTVWSELELKDAEEPEDDSFANSPFQGGALDEEQDETEEDLSQVAAAPTADGRVNVNTAPLMVLRALAPEDIPTSFLERVVEYRNRITELRQEWDEGVREPGATFGQQDEDSQDAADGTEEDDDNDPTKYVFESESEVFDKVESEWDLSVFTDDADKSAFTDRLGVISNVFTIRVHLLDEQTRRRTSYRTVVWRMETDDEPRIVTLLPLEEYADPRREEDFPENVADLAERRFERDDGRRYELR